MIQILSDAHRERFARLVRQEMAKRKLNRDALAYQVKCAGRTIGNLLAGHRVHDKHVASVADALDIKLDILPGSSEVETEIASSVCNPLYGSYTRDTHKGLIGVYALYRRLFSQDLAGKLYRTIIEIDWDDDLRALTFYEVQARWNHHGKTTVSHSGTIYLSAATNLLQMLTNDQGSLRLINFRKPSAYSPYYRGLILTQADREDYFQPAASAVLMRKFEVKPKPALLDRLNGPFGEDDPEYSEILLELTRTEADSVYMAGSTKRAAASIPHNPTA